MAQLSLERRLPGEPDFRLPTSTSPRRRRSKIGKCGKGAHGRTGSSGKTVLALSAVERAKIETTLIVVPTVALLEQWWDEAAAFFGLRLDDIHVVPGRSRLRVGTINLAVMNTAAKIAPMSRPCFLIVDECHKAASPKLRAILDLPKVAALGLSATPERPYDEGLEEVLVPALGPVLFRYTWRASNPCRHGTWSHVNQLRTLLRNWRNRGAQLPSISLACAALVARI